MIVLLGLLWAPTNLAIKLASEGGFSPVALIALRWWTAVGLLCLALTVPAIRKSLGYRAPDRDGKLRSIAFGALFFAPAQITFVVGLTQTSTIEAAIILTTAPIWTGVLGWLLLREKVPGARWLAIGLGLVGAYVVSVGFHMPQLQAGHTEGNLLYLAACFWESFAWVGNTRTARESSAVGSLVYKLLGASLAFMLVAAFCGSTPSLAWHLGTGPAAYGGLAFLVFVPGLFCFALWYWVAERVPVSLLSLTTLIPPPIAALLGWLLLGESVGTSTGVGALLLVVSLMLSMREKVAEAAEPGT